MNRRSETRHNILLQALVHPKVGRPWTCSIRDYCRGGMLLVSDAGQPTLAQASGKDQEPGDPVNVHFSLPVDGKQRHFRAQAQIARILSSSGGVGVRFPTGLDSATFTALADFSAGADGATGGSVKADARDARVSAEDAARVRGHLRRMMERAVPRIARAFFERADKDLLVRARDAGTNAVQNTFFEAMSLLERKRRTVEGDFLGSILDQFDRVRSVEEVLAQRRERESAAGTAEGQLALVDTDRFEDWLATAQIVNAAESTNAEHLSAIRLRMGLLAGAWGNKDANPLSPATLTRALDEAMDQVGLSEGMRRHLYRSMQTAVAPLFRNLYSSIDKFLADSGIFPALEELQARKVVKAPLRSPSRPAGDAGATGNVGMAEPAGADLNRSYIGAPVPGQAPGVGAPGSVLGQQGASVGAAQGAAQPGAGGPGNGPILPGGAMGQSQSFFGANNVYNTAKELLTLQRNALRQSGQLRPETVATDPQLAFSSDEVVAALTELQHSGHVGAAPLRDQLVSALRARTNDPARGLSEPASDAFEVVESLVASIQQDEFVTSGVKDWVKRLEITLTKLAAKDNEFLSGSATSPHAAIEVLNQLAKLGNAGDVSEGIDREVGRRVDELMDQVVSDYDGNPAVFNEVLSALHPLVERQSRAYQGNFERTVRASEGQQKLSAARRAALSALEDRVADRPVADLVMQLLAPGWRNLLVHAHLRHGPDSSAWRDNLKVVDQLIERLDGVPAADDKGSQQLLQAIRGGLESISFDPSKRAPLLASLEQALGGSDVGSLHRTLLQRDAVAEQLGLDGVQLDAEPEPDHSEEGLRENWQDWLTRSRKLQVGDYLAVNDDTGRPKIVTVAFVGEDHSSFVVVNRKGIKVREYTLRTMTEALGLGQVSILDEFELPLMERATHRMLQNMHNQLAYLAAHDELTGLINRKEFEKRVEKSITSARTHGYEHALLHIDLDQFKIINNTSGNAAGDELLKVIAGKLKHEARGTRSNIARLGGDEFGVLIERVDFEVATKFAERQLAGIRATRFDWEDRHFAVSASIGLAAIDGEADDAALIMRYADSACFAAKDAGRSRIQRYERSDHRLARRHGVMEWVSEIDRALDENRLVLNCQRIAPIGSDPDTEVHYEILLTMLDDRGEMIAPTDFIFAAESYNRMAAVDQWVIEHALAWMSKNRATLDRIGGISINISGHSINDEGFADFVLRQFSTSRVPTGKVCFEITETAAIANLDNAVNFINKMKLIGCKFSLDDFGTGLSSYSYLRNLPVDFIKIDGVFVKDLSDNPGDYAVVKSINEIGHFMGKKTIAEFVENDEILEQLREIGVDYAQGYGIERPCLLEQLEL